MKRNSTVKKIISAAVAALAMSSVLFTACADESGNRIVNPDDETVKPCVHSSVSFEQGRPARCNAAGYESYWVCTDCGTAFGDSKLSKVITAPKTIPATEHKKLESWNGDGAGHWRECANCDERFDEAKHVCDREVADDEFLKTEATATSGAVYYKSCVCGAKSEDTFTVLPNVAKGKPVKSDCADGREGTASTDGHAYGGLKYLLDGNVNTRYHTAVKNSATFVIDLQDEYSLNNLSICQYDGRIKTIKISVATGELDWDNILSNTSFTVALEQGGITSPNDCNRDGNNGRELTSFGLDGKRARYVKIEFTVPDSNLTLFDLMIFGLKAE